MITFEIEDITIEELIEENPPALCTPMMGELPVLQIAVTQVAATMTWRWYITRELQADRCRITVGDRSKVHILAPPAPLHMHANDSLAITATLSQI